MRHVIGTARAPPTPDLFDEKKVYKPEELATLEAAELKMDRHTQNEFIVKQQIFATIPNSLLLKVQTKNTAAEVWNAVQAEMKNKSDMYRVDMRQRLGDLKCAEGGNVEAHLETLAMMREEYATIGGVLSDAEFKTIILSSTPSSYPRLPSFHYHLCYPYQHRDHPRETSVRYS